MTPHLIPTPPFSPGPAAPPPAALPSTAAIAPPPASLSSIQLMAALGVSRQMLKKWNHFRVIPSTGRGRARRYELARVMEALWAHGQPDLAVSSASAASSTAPGMGGPAGMASDYGYQFLPQ